MRLVTLGSDAPQKQGYSRIGSELVVRPGSRSLRCAVCARKSSGGGLEQDFNSLHAHERLALKLTTSCYCDLAINGYINVARSRPVPWDFGEGRGFFPLEQNSEPVTPRMLFGPGL